MTKWMPWTGACQYLVAAIVFSYSCLDSEKSKTKESCDESVKTSVTWIITVLVFFATTQETATQLCIILSDPLSKSIEYPFASWIEGSAVGLLIIATFHPFIFHKSMVFIPTAVFLLLQILFYLGILIAEIFNVNGNSQMIFFFRGMLDCPCCLYMYFIIPLKIASHYRKT